LKPPTQNERKPSRDGMTRKDESTGTNPSS
jgi:hypothetical protein